jgi:hypothetical protein
MAGKTHTVGDRIQALVLIEEGVSIAWVMEVSGMSKASTY